MRSGSGQDPKRPTEIGCCNNRLFAGTVSEHIVPRKNYSERICDSTTHHPRFGDSACTLYEVSPDINSLEMRSLIAAAAIAAASATPYDYPAVGAFPGYLCNFQLNDALMNTYNFDLRQIAGQQPSFVIPNTYNYTFGVCGVAGPACTTNNQIWSLAAGYQIPFNSGACEVLSVGPPLHSLADSSNAATGGIQTTFAGGESAALPVRVYLACGAVGELASTSASLAIALQRGLRMPTA